MAPEIKISFKYKFSFIRNIFVYNLKIANFFFYGIISDETKIIIDEHFE